MDEATPTIALQHSAVIAVLARQSAIKAVKEQLRRQGLKPAHIAKREIVAIAEDYLAQRRQAFLEQTAERVRTSPALRALSESNASASACLNETQQICTAREGLIHKGFRCAELMRKMEKINDRRLRSGINRWPTLDAQHAALAAAGAEKVFAEKISGAVTDRKALAKAIAALGPGDVLLVTRLDRLARSNTDLLNVLDAVARGAGFRSLADAWADTTTPHGRLMLTVLGGLAEFERELIKARTDEHINGKRPSLGERLARLWSKLVGATTSATRQSLGSNSLYTCAADLS